MRKTVRKLRGRRHTGDAGPAAVVRKSGVPAFVRVALPVLITFLLALPCPTARAVLTYDLLHDTESTRRMIKDELEQTRLPMGGEVSEETAPVAHGELESIWFAREKFLQIGEAGKARAQIDLLWEKQMESGIRNLPEYGEVLVREALRDMDRGRLDVAKGDLDMARRIAPESLPVYFASAVLVLKKSLLNVTGALEELIQAVKAIQRSFRLQSWIAANTFFTVFYALCLFFTAVVAALVLRRARYIAHDLSETLPKRLLPITRSILGWLLLLLPVLAGLPVWWWLVLGGLLVLPYLDRFPRTVVILAALFLFTLPWQIRLASSLLSMHRQPLLERLILVREGHWTDDDFRTLKGLEKAGYSDALIHFAHGLVAKRRGLFDEAEKAYEKSLTLAPGNAGVWNNLGNLSLIRKEYDQAIERYKKSIGMDQGLFAPHYNLSLAYREKFLFPEGEAESRRAVAIDPEANAYYTSTSGIHFNRYTVDVVPSLKRIWQLAVSENKWQAATADHLWMSLTLVPSRQMWPFVLGSILLLGGIWYALRSSGGLARSCHKCGRVYCLRCRGGREASLCSQCHHIFVRKEGVEARVRVRKMADIKRNQQIANAARIVSAFIVPGGGHLVAGHFVAGVFFALPSCFILARLITAGELYPALWHLRLTGGTLTTVPLVIVLAALWIVSLLQAFRMEE